MAINGFVLLLLVLASLSYFIPVENKSKKNANEDIALLTFTNSTMYTLTPASMNRIVYADKALRYKDRDVMIDGALTLKGKSKDGKDITDIVYSDLIIKRGDAFKFLNNVKYERDDYITLITDELLYDAKSRIATNTLPFEGTYFNNYIKGENIYLDLNKYYMKSKKILILK